MNYSSIQSRLFWIVIYSLCIVGGCVVTLFLIFPVNQNTIKPSIENLPIISPPFSLRPPSQSLQSTLTEKIGSVLHKTRDADTFVEASPSATIFIGESLTTASKGKATIIIPSLATLTMEENSELVFANMYKENTVFQQKSGIIRYDIDSLFPASVRALHVLISSKQSSVLIRIINNDIQVTTQKGEANIAFVDNQNTTHVYTIPVGKRANIDDISRTISIVSPR